MNRSPARRLARFATGVRYALAILVLGTCGTPDRYPVVSGPRDWEAHPAIVVRAAPTDAPLYAVSDVHGGFARLVALLARHGVVAAAGASPTDVHWRGGAAVLVIAGDMIDKGPSSLEVIELARSLGDEARAAGGDVIALLGNHEAEFFADPLNAKADADDGIDPELRARAIDPMALANGSDPRGRWLRERPFGAKVGGWFFSHAGSTGGRSVEALERALRASVDADDYTGAETVGTNSLLEARAWWLSASAAANARALGVEHFVFGHTPSALGARGAIASAEQGRLFRIDCGMSPGVNDSPGALLRVRVEAGRELAESLGADGSVRMLWRAP